MKIRIVDLLKSDIYGIDVYVRGWVRTHRQSKNISFIALNDGSTVHNLQIVIEHAKFEKNMLKTITTGSAIGIKGKFIRSAGGKQQVEVIAENIAVYGVAAPLTEKGTFFRVPTRNSSFTLAHKYFWCNISYAP